MRSASLASPKLTATLLGLFGLLALVITAAGIAGVIAFSVNQRTQEFGIRMALGAQRGSVLGMVLRQGLKLVLAGLAIGLAGALVLTRVLTTLLFGIEPTDGIDVRGRVHGSRHGRSGGLLRSRPSGGISRSDGRATGGITLGARGLGGSAVAPAARARPEAAERERAGAGPREH